MIRLQQVKLPIEYKEKDLREKIIKTLRIQEQDLESYTVFRRSLDARKKADLKYVFIVDCLVKQERKLLKKNKKLIQTDHYSYSYPVKRNNARPIIVGFGPAGIFAAYIMAEMGMEPIIFEQGEAVDERSLSVEKFWSEGVLNKVSNVQFGEGGAGTFSDGKLTSRSKDPRSQKVFEILVKHGAPEEILYSNKPHVGTDLLKGVVKNIRESIIGLGGEIHFNHKVTDFKIENQAVQGVYVEEKLYESKHVVLAIGHSARDTYEVLYNHNLMMHQKAFAMGVRIEHHQAMINKNQYGDEKHAKILGASDYKLTYSSSNGRSVYSFCVCPGGMVVASASEPGKLVVNGMSEHARGERNINGALLVQVKPEDFESEHPLSGVEFQRKYENLAFKLGGSNYTAPIETVGSFLSDEVNQIERIEPSYRPSVHHAKLRDCLPEFIVVSLKEGIKHFGNKIQGFSDSDAILTAIESRSSSPVRFERNDMESNVIGLYPVGEGAGYAGGIISSAIDGIKVAEIISMKC